MQLLDLQTSEPPSELLDTENTKRWEADRVLYQQKIGSVLYTAISTRPDIAFAVCRLSQFNARPGTQHHDAVNRVLRYLYSTRESYLISYGGQEWDQSSPFTCASDASFADDRIDRKSSQGYVMKLFGGPIAWRANKQDTVTTSSTEAELLAISQAAKEGIYLQRLMGALSLSLPKNELVIECDNRQTLRLLTEQSTQLSTKLRHVDIHNHWLRQEVQEGRIQVEWTQSAKMIADGLTKALSREKHREFLRMLGMAGPGPVGKPTI